MKCRRRRIRRRRRPREFEMSIRDVYEEMRDDGWAAGPRRVDENG